MKLWIIAAALAVGAFAQSSNPDPVQWSLSSDAAKAPPGSTITLRLTAKIDSGWHIYSLTHTSHDDGPNPTTITLDDADFVVRQPEPIKKVDPTLGYEIEEFTGEPTFLIDVHLKKD